MKTRIFYTKLWEDDFIASLTLGQKALFIYFITNQRIGQTGIYEITDRIILFETGANKEQLQQAKELFSKANKILFTDGWVKVVNSEKYNAYTGENNEKAYAKELEGVSEGIISTFDTLSEGYQAPSIPLEGLINNKSEIRNKKSEITGVVKGGFGNIDSLHAIDFEEIATDYDVPIAFVKSKYDDMVNWHEENPRKNNKLNWKATLKNWVKKDAIERRSKHEKLSKITYVGESLDS